MSGIENIEGINFLGSDGDTTEYFFGEGGLTGTVDENGLVHGGALPEIIIKPAGILVE